MFLLTRRECRRMRRSKIMCLLMLIVVLCTACGKETEAPENSATKAPAESVVDVLEESPPVDKEKPGADSEESLAPTTNEELFSFITEKWKSRRQMTYLSMQEKNYRH